MKAWIILALLITGCADQRYSDNPRNMANMTAGQIERAVAGE